jgi:hypothetical protein
MHAICGIIKLINNDQYTRLSVFKLPCVFFCKAKLVQHSERCHRSLCNSCHPVYEAESHVEVGMLGTAQ